MIKQGNQRDEITKKFAILRYYVEYSNKVGKTDINLELEDFFCGLFNIIQRSKFYNINSKKRNFPAVDLADDELKTAIQITSNARKEKIMKTISKFNENELYHRWNNLKIFIIGEKSKKVILNLPRNLRFTIEIEDMNDLYDQITRSLNSEKREKVIEYMRSELETNITRMENRLDIPHIEVNHFVNAKALLIDYMEESDDDYIIELRERVRGLCTEMMLLSQDQRIYIYSAIKRTIKENSHEIYFDFNDIKMFFSNDEIVKNVLTSLVAKEIIEQELYEKSDFPFWAGKIKSKGNFDVELLRYIISFCKQKHKDLAKFFLDLDFSILD